MHVRPSGDAFWPSQYAPWSEWLTGKRDGSRPGLGPDGVHDRRDARPQPRVPRLVQPVPGRQPAPVGGPGADFDQARAQPPAAPAPGVGGRLPGRHDRQPALLRPRHPGGPPVRRGLDAGGGAAATTSTACTSTTSSTRTRRRGRTSPTTPASPRYGAGLREQGRLAPGQRQHAGPRDERADQGDQAVGEVRHQPVRHLAQQRAPTRPARPPAGCRATTTSTPTPGCGSREGGWTTSCRSSTGTSASTRPTTPSCCRGGRTWSRAPACSSTSARPTTGSARRAPGRTRPSWTASSRSTAGTAVARQRALQREAACAPTGSARSAATATAHYAAPGAGARDGAAAGRAAGRAAAGRRARDRRRRGRAGLAGRRRRSRRASASTGSTAPRRPWSPPAAPAPRSWTRRRRARARPTASAALDRSGNESRAQRSAWRQPVTLPSATSRCRVVRTASSIRRSWVTSSSVPG